MSAVFSSAVRKKQFRFLPPLVLHLYSNPDLIMLASLTCRAYNPRLFRLQHRLDTNDGDLDTTASSTTSLPEKTRDPKRVSP